jgi:hypothetical protein
VRGQANRKADLDGIFTQTLQQQLSPALFADGKDRCVKEAKNTEEQENKTRKDGIRIQASFFLQSAASEGFNKFIKLN